MPRAALLRQIRALLKTASYRVLVLIRAILLESEK